MPDETGATNAFRHDPSGARYRILFEQSRDAIYIADLRGGMVELNPSGLQLLGYTAEDLKQGPVRAYSDEDALWKLLHVVETEGSARDFEMRLRTKTGEELNCLLSAAPMRDRSGDLIGYLGTIQDITARKIAEERLWHAALHDPLTGLPNRKVFADRLERSLTRARRRTDYNFAVLFLDLDNFKVVNDTFGHLAGDRLLMAAARRIESAVRPEDTVARVGGDEFAILLYNVADPGFVRHIAERVQERLRERFTVEAGSVHITASAGITLSTTRYATPEEVLRDADIAMYRAKENGREQYAFFDPEMAVAAAADFPLERELRRAIEFDELRVEYQPLVVLEQGLLSGFEALVRWQHPEHGLMQPGRFIPLAERLDIVEQIDRWVLLSASRQMRQWQKEFGREDLVISVNFAGKTFLQPDLLALIDEALAESGLPPSTLRIEVTESVVLNNLQAADANFRELRERGVQICIDDFGGGYSSFSYLTRFPIDVLKIDRNYVEGIDAEERNKEVVRAIILLARNLGLQAIAGGTETAQQLDSLRELGSLAAQGYLFSRPVGPAIAGELIRTGLPALPTPAHR
ncbi:MAG: putative bifunctional diguanylate cyclase/phosphodiesterase [Longimicrobiales bacterium]